MAQISSGRDCLYFFPHRYLRDFQLDTVRRWPIEEVLNPEILEAKRGLQIDKNEALAYIRKLSWKQRVPLLNVKRRPSGLPNDAIVYVWGAIIASGRFIVDLENPYALTGYNIRAMSLYRGVLSYLLGSRRCVEIRCWSNACRETVRHLFGDRILNRTVVYYPYILQKLDKILGEIRQECRFLFISTQFDIKGGAALLKAFQRVYEIEPTAHLDLVTHLPAEYAPLVKRCPGITVHEAHFSQEEIFTHFMKRADVLVHPTYVDSLGMVVLEALAHGLAVVATDVYALPEMVEDGVNGALLKPPLSIWDGYLPSRYYYQLRNIKRYIHQADTSLFEEQLATAMLRFAQHPEYRLQARRASLALFERRFSRTAAGDG